MKTPIDNLAHAISCNSGGMTEEGHAHLLEAAKAVVALDLSRDEPSDEEIDKAYLELWPTFRNKVDLTKRICFSRGARWALSWRRK